MNTATTPGKDRPKQITRVAVLWAHVTGYLQAALQALLADETGQVGVLQQRNGNVGHWAGDKQLQLAALGKRGVINHLGRYFCIELPVLCRG